MLRKQLQTKTDFANFCINHNVESFKVAELIQIIKRCVAEGVRNCNEQDRPYSKLSNLYDKVESSVKATNPKWRVKGWPGLYPLIVDQNNREINLPY